jgi:hypothetical protein
MAAVQRPIGILGSHRNKPFQERKRRTRDQVPRHRIFAGAQKLNVMPVVAALMVAPPMVSLAASREQTW